MKKTNLYSSFAVLFVIAAVTPQTVWSKNCDFKNRMPASEQINCLKEEKDKLEKDIKKLIDDKEKIVKELDEVKAKKDPEEKVSEEKKKEKEKKDKKIAADNEVFDLMFDMTSLLMSQQQQQTMMMNQMFSMMSSAMQRFSYPQQPQQQYDSLFPFGQFGTVAGHNPYSLESLGSSFSLHHAKWNPLSLEGVGGIGLGHQYTSHQNIYQDNFVKTPYRYPAEQPAQLERQQLLFQPPIHGYDFGQNPSTNVEPVPQQMEQQKIPQLKQAKYI